MNILEFSTDFEAFSGQIEKSERPIEFNRRDSQEFGYQTLV